MIQGGIFWMASRLFATNDLSASVATPSRRRLWLGMAILAALVAGMVWDTKIVKIHSAEDVEANVFSPEKFGAEQFPKLRAAVTARAGSAEGLAAAIAADKDAAGKQYGVPGSLGPEMAVKFEGVAGEASSGVYDVKVAGVPEGLRIRVQTGPAINGTDLRDSTGTITFGQFVNQIEYQNAGSALNKEMKKQVLSKIDNANLTGKTLKVVGVFQLFNVKSWLVTPVSVEVK
jgi:predicted lipoprotein